MKVGPDVGVDDGAELGEDFRRVEVCVSVVAADPSDYGSDIAIEVEEAGRGHLLPVASDSSDAFPIRLETLEWTEVNARVFLEELL